MLILKIFKDTKYDKQSLLILNAGQTAKQIHLKFSIE